MISQLKRNRLNEFFLLFAKTDEDDELRCVQLTNQHKTAIRFIRKVSQSFSIHFQFHSFRFKREKKPQLTQNFILPTKHTNPPRKKNSNEKTTIYFKKKHSPIWSITSKLPEMENLTRWKTLFNLSLFFSEFPFEFDTDRFTIFYTNTLHHR